MNVPFIDLRMQHRTLRGEFNRAMILAAGEGTRLRPLTLHRPKPMLPVAGRPVLEHIVAWLRYYGITEIVINLHHCPQMVIDHFDDGAAYGVEIMYSIEEAILGTAGAVRRVADFFEGPFVLVYGDVLTDLNLADLIAFHRRQPARAHLSMSLYQVSNPWACGVVNLDTQGRVTRFVEKPFREDSFSQLANAGVLVMDPAILEHVPDGCCYDFGQDLFPRLLQLAIPMYGWLLPDTAYLIDIGTPENYARVQREWPTLRARAYL